MKIPDQFLGGETVILAPPRREDFKEWAAWISDVKTMRFLKHGKYPMTESQQREWYEKETENGRLLLMVRSRLEDELLGVVSMSELDWENSMASIAGVLPKKSRTSKFAALESRALLMEHVFTNFGLRKLNSSQVFPGNLRWTAFQALIGWTVESYGFDVFKKGETNVDVVNLSARESLFKELFAMRGGSLWPGQEAVENLRNSRIFMAIAANIESRGRAEKERLAVDLGEILKLAQSYEK